MTSLRACRQGWQLAVVTLFVVLGTGWLASPAAATPTYEGGASAGWADQEGEVLTANPGTWSSTTAITYSYAWFDENSVRLGTGPSYTVTGSNVGHQIYAAITASDAAAPSLTVNTPTVGPMRYRPPLNTEKPTVTGSYLQGATLVASPGKWVSGGASTAAINIGYSWYRNCGVGPNRDCSNTGLIGSTNSLQLTSADLGRMISLTITASYPDGTGGQASNSIWIGNLGPVIASSITAGDTLSGTIPWTVTAPNAQTIAFSVTAVQTVTLVASAGSATLDLDTSTLPNGSNALAVTVAWTDGTTTTVPIGSVTVTNVSAPPTVVSPVIARPVLMPKHPLAGHRLVVTLAVTRSDNHHPLTQGTMICDPSVQGKVLAHTESFTRGTAKLSFAIPRNMKGKLLKVKVTIKVGSQLSTRTATFRIG